MTYALSRKTSNTGKLSGVKQPSLPDGSLENPRILPPVNRSCCDQVSSRLLAWVMI